MQPFLWRSALIGIILITLVGSIILLIVEPGFSSVLGVVGSIGSVLGTFVTTGLDITQRKAREQAAPAPAAPTYLSEPRYMPRAALQRSSSISWLAVIQAATVGAVVAGFIGLLPELPLC